VHRSQFIASRAALAVAAAISVAFGVQAAHPGGAAASWCFDDPVVQIGGSMVETTVGIAADPSVIAAHVHGATITYALPANALHSVVRYTSSPYFPERIVFTTSTATWIPGLPVPVKVTVAFQSDLTLPTQVINTAEPASQGAEQSPSQGTPFTMTSFGTTATPSVAVGLTPEFTSLFSLLHWSR
jgi:hypothetical protein